MTIGRLKAGISEKEITPLPGTRLAVEFGPQMAQSTATPLMAKALVLANMQTTLVILTLDLYGVEPVWAARLQQAAAEAANVPEEAVMVISSHTRGGPYSTPVVGWPDLDAPYLEGLLQQTSAVVTEAKANLQEASLGYGQIRLPHLVYNHRLMTRNMKAITAWMGIPKNEVLEPEGPVDHAFGVFVLRDQHGFPICLAWNFAADNRFPEDGKISGGIASTVQQEVDTRFGKHVPLLYLPGCGGNTSFQHGLSESTDAVASAVIAACLETSCDPSIRLSCTAVKAILPVRDTSCLWSQPDIERKAPHALDAYQRELEYLQRENLQAVPAHVKAFRLGQYCLVGLPGYPFVEFSLAVKEKSPARATMVAANTGEHLGYVITQQAFEDEGFESWPARSALTGPGAGEFLAEQAVLLACKLWR